MRKKSSSSSSMPRRAWRLLRLLLLWAKKGKGFRNKLLLGLRPLPKYLKTLHRTASHSHRLHYNERQFSFNGSPAFHFKMHRPVSMRQLHIPCFNALAVDFDGGDSGRISFGMEEKVCSSNTQSPEKCEESCEIDEEGDIDSKVEKFIANFYKQIELQRQVSLSIDEEGDIDSKAEKFLGPEKYFPRLRP